MNITKQIKEANHEINILEASISKGETNSITLHHLDATQTVFDNLTNAELNEAIEQVKKDPMFIGFVANTLLKVDAVTGNIKINEVDYNITATWNNSWNCYQLSSAQNMSSAQWVQNHSDLWESISEAIDGANII